MMNFEMSMLRRLMVLVVWLVIWFAGWMDMFISISQQAPTVFQIDIVGFDTSRETAK